jgi:beta-galactosidase
LAEDSNPQIRPKLETILYCASYYHEYMPCERLVQDIALMKDAGMSVVRVGESTWSLWEPEDSAFEHAWMDRVVDARTRHTRRVRGLQP